ncbi:hypothetical protein Tco_0685154 [Tanacetum coccineum]
MVKNKGLVAEAYEWHEEDMSSDDNDMTEVKVLIALADDENVVVGKESTRNGEWVKIYMRKLSEAEGFTLSNHDTSRILLAESQVKITDPLVAITDSSATEYDSLKTSQIVAPLSSTGELACAKPRFISLRRGIKPRNPQQVTKSYETYGSTFHTTTDHNDIGWFRKGEALQAKKAEEFQSKKTESSNANRSMTPTKRHITGVKSYMHKYVEQLGPKAVFRDDSTCITEGYGSIKKNLVFFAKATKISLSFCIKVLAHKNFKTITNWQNKICYWSCPHLVYFIRKDQFIMVEGTCYR